MFNIAIIFGLLISTTHYFSEVICQRCKTGKEYSPLFSFSAGISTTYIFLHLFPRFSIGAAQTSQYLFISVLAGFVVLHLVEKYIYQHSPEEKLLRELALEDSIISFIYHLFVGIVLVSLFSQSFTEGLLFFFIVLFYTAISTLPVDVPKFRSMRIIVASSTSIGVILSSFVFKSITPLSQPWIYYNIMGFIIGALSFTVTRHSLPHGKKGSPLYFTLGVVLYTLLIFFI
ncbi:hypothetical protein GF336_02865 [Candidatus Woesearchaeota archaeon]|nr:hypothetical protein [Candidatus Woesearchaeota archaeon]